MADEGSIKRYKHVLVSQKVCLDDEEMFSVRVLMRLSDKLPVLNFARALQFYSLYSTLPVCFEELCGALNSTDKFLMTHCSVHFGKHFGHQDIDSNSAINRMQYGMKNAAIARNDCNEFCLERSESIATSVFCNVLSVIEPSQCTYPVSLCLCTTTVSTKTSVAAWYSI